MLKAASRGITTLLTFLLTSLTAGAADMHLKAPPAPPPPPPFTWSGFYIGGGVDSTLAAIWAASGPTTSRLRAEMQLAETTIEVHRATIMRKIEAKSLAELVRMADIALEKA
jgi:Bacterial regulatory proteins, luxR family